MDIRRNGISLQYCEYPTLDEDLIIAFNAEAHDQVSNRFVATSIESLVELVSRRRAKIPGGDWGAVSADLLQIYGVRRRKFVWQMVQWARHMPLAVTAAAAANKVPNTWLADNPYFTGSGTSAHMKLSEAAMEKVIEHVADDVKNMLPVNAKTIISNYCLPLQKAEAWLTKMKKFYGDAATSASPYAAVAT